MKPWLPALAAFVAAIVLATGVGVALNGLPTTPGSASPVAMKTVTPGALERTGIHLTHAAVPVECMPAAWLHLNLLRHCPISQSEAEAAARSALPIFKPMPVMITTTTTRKTTVTANATTTANATNNTTTAPTSPQAVPAQVREAVMAWADVPASAAPGSVPLHELVWVVAVDQPISVPTCAPPVRYGALTTSVACLRITAPRYLVFVDALSGKVRLLMARP